MRYRIIPMKDSEIFIPSGRGLTFEQKIEKKDRSLLNYGGIAAFSDMDLLILDNIWFEGDLDVRECGVRFGRVRFASSLERKILVPLHAKVFCVGKVYTKIPYSDLKFIMKFGARVKLHLLLEAESGEPDEEAARDDVVRNLYGILPRLLAKYMASSLRRRFRVIFNNWFRKVGKEYREMVFPVYIALWGGEGHDKVRLPASITVYRCKCGVICYGVYEALAHYFKDHRGKSKEELLKQMEMNLQVMKGVLKYYLEKGYSKKDLVNLYRGIHALEKYLLKARASQ